MKNNTAKVVVVFRCLSFLLSKKYKQTLASRNNKHFETQWNSSMSYLLSLEKISTDFIPHIYAPYQNVSISLPGNAYFFFSTTYCTSHYIILHYSTGHNGHATIFLAACSIYHETATPCEGPVWIFYGSRKSFWLTCLTNICQGRHPVFTTTKNSGFYEATWPRPARH